MKKIKLVEACLKIGSGATPRGGKNVYCEKGISLIRSQNVLDFDFSENGLVYINEGQASKLNNVEVMEGDVLLNITGDSVARATIMKSDFLPARVNQHVAIIRAKKEIISPLYLLYFLQYQKSYLLQLASAGATRNALTKSMIAGIELELPSLDIQRKIVSILNDIQEKILENKKINENLEQQVSILYQSWFEDFKITNGVCPEDWSYQELSSIADIASGKRPPVKSNVCNQETPISIVGAASVMGFTSEANHTDKILVTGRVGTHGVVQRFNTPCWTSDNTLVITSPYYEFTNQILHRIDYSSMNRGSTQPLITQGDMKKVVVLVPDENTLAKFEEFAGSLMVKWEANNKENVKLASLRDTLLRKLMSGEFDVSDIDL